MSASDIIGGVAGIASLIPGVGTIVGGGLSILSGFIAGGEKRKEAERLRLEEQQKAISAASDLYYQKLAKGGTVKGKNPYREITNSNFVPKQNNGIPDTNQSPMQAYAFEKAMDDLNDQSPPTGDNLIKLKDNREIDHATGVKVASDKRVNHNIGKSTVKEIIVGASRRGIDPATALAMAIQETGMQKMNYFHDRTAGLKGMELTPEEEANNVDGNEQIRKIAKQYPTGVTSAQWNDSSFDKIKTQFDYGKSLGKTEEADIIQSFNGYGKVKDLYGIPGETDMSKNPLYGKRIIDIRENVIKKNPEIIKLINEYNELSKKETKKDKPQHLAEGGAVTGPGTTTSDSIKTTLDEGDVVVPAKHGRLAKEIGEKYLGWKPNEVVDIGGDRKVALSKREVVFKLAEVQRLAKFGIDINNLID